MNKQRKVVITTTYNDLGVIIDTKAEELDSSTQPNLQLTCNQLATDTISRQAAIDAVISLCDDCDSDHCGSCRVDYPGEKDARKALEDLPPAQPEIIHCRDCKHWKTDHPTANGYHCCHRIHNAFPMREDDFCSRAERQEE